MSEKRPWHYYALWIVAAVSLTLNLVILYSRSNFTTSAGWAA